MKSITKLLPETPKKTYKKPNNINYTYLKNLVLAFLVIVIICTIPISITSYKFISKNISLKTSEYNEEILNQIKKEINTRLLQKVNDISLSVLYDVKDNKKISYISNYPINDCMTRIIDVKDYVDKRKTLVDDIDLIGIYFWKQNILVTSKFVRLGFLIDEMNYHDGELKYFKDIIKDNEGRNFFWLLDKNYPYYFSKRKNPLTSPMLHFVRNYTTITKDNVSLNASIILSISYQHMKEMLVSILLNWHDNIIIIADNKGEIIYHTSVEYVGRKINEFNFLISEEDIKTQNIDNKKYEVTHLIDNDSEWTYIILTPIDELKNITDYVMKTILLVVILTIGFGALISFIMAKKLSNPIEKIIFKWKDIANKPDKISIEPSFIENIMDTMSEKLVSQTEKIKDAYPMVKSNFLRDLINGKLKNRSEVEKKLNLLGYSMQHEKFIVIVIKNKVKELLEKDDIILNILINDCFKESSTICISSIIDDYIVVFFNTSQNEKKLSQNILSIIINDFEENNFIIGVGTPQLSIIDTDISYKQAKKMLSYSFFYPERNIFLFREVDNAITKSKDIYLYTNANMNARTHACTHMHTYINTFNDNFILKFKYRLGDFNIDGAIDSVIKIFIELKSKYYSIEEYSLIINKIITTISHYIKLFNLENNFEEFINCTFDIENIPYGVKNINELESYFILITRKLFDEIESIKENRYLTVMEQAMKYIDANICNSQLSLERVSDYFNMSPNYFSKQFKKNTGINFSEYVSEKKIQKIKELLVQTNYNLDKISEIVGYSTPQYLINKFKLECGITPSQYRIKSLSKS